MPDYTSLTRFIRDRIGEDRANAEAAIHPDRPGSHWEWVDDNTDSDLIFDGGSHLETNASLRSVEHFTEEHSSYHLPAFLIWSVDDAFPPALAHIAHNDPARVLADCDARLAILDRCAAELDSDPAFSFAGSVLVDLAMTWREDEGFDLDWVQSYA